MKKEIITMVHCPYCEKEWIQDQELICKECEPRFKADMTLSDLLSCIETLSKIEHIPMSRYKILVEALDSLETIKEKFKRRL